MGTLAACGNGTKTDSAGNDANSSKTEQVSSEAEQSGTDDSLQRVLDAGVLSVGMLLCAEDAECNLSLITPEKAMPSGAEIC